jgi:protein ImuB
LACIDLPALPLQLLARAHPEWHGHPAVVVADDEPQARVLWVNERARQAGILPGHRYAAALALAHDLQAGVVHDAQVAAAVSEITQRLRRFSPDIEPCDAEAGVFWVHAGGLELLHPTLTRWAGLVRRGLARAGLLASVAVGFTRFGSYALARQECGLQVLPDPATELAAARRVPLARLAIPPKARDTLSKLGVRTVGALARLPGDGLRRRFGPELHHLHRLANDPDPAPLRPAPPPQPLRAARDFEWTETSLLRCIRVWRALLEPLLEQTAARGGAVTAVTVTLKHDGAVPATTVTVKPAEPVLDVVTLLNLLQLHFDRHPFAAGVTATRVECTPARATAEQLRLFVERAGRDLRAADRAIARLQAELGPEAVVRAELRDGHLPEATYGWRRAERTHDPEPQAVREPALVRRILDRPRPLPPPEPGGEWRLAGPGSEPVVRRLGPYIVSGGWWATPVHREYHFAETRSGEVWWVYYDRKRNRWYLQGTVE